MKGDESMRKLAAVLLIFWIGASTQAFAVEGTNVEYVNGTVQGVKEGTTGTLESTSHTLLEFRSGVGQFSIPYGEIAFVKCQVENRFRLGVLPAIAVGLVKARAKRHFVTIGWKHGDDLPQVVALDTSREKYLGLIAVLLARAPKACPSAPGQFCGAYQ